MNFKATKGTFLAFSAFLVIRFVVCFIYFNHGFTVGKWDISIRQSIR